MFSDTHNFFSFYRQAKSEKLVKRDARWTFVFQDWLSHLFPMDEIKSKANFITMTKDECCIVSNKPKGKILEIPMLCMYDFQAVMGSQTFG